MKRIFCTIAKKLQNKVWQCIQDYSVLAGGKMAEICGLPCENWKGSGFCDADGQQLTAITILVRKNENFATIEFT